MEKNKEYVLAARGNGRGPLAIIAALLLLDSIPDIAMSGKPPTRVASEVPNPLDPPAGCAFHPRCPCANDRCRSEHPELLPASTGTVACHAVDEGRLLTGSDA